MWKSLEHATRDRWGKGEIASKVKSKPRVSEVQSKSKSLREKLVQGRKILLGKYVSS